MMLCPSVYIEFGKKINSMDDPQNNSKLIDVASGTGDIAKLFLKN